MNRISVQLCMQQTGHEPVDGLCPNCGHQERTAEDTLQRAITYLEGLEAEATSGPWQWWNLEGVDQGWTDNGPTLETVARGPVYSDGSQGAERYVISAWGHDAWGISVGKADAALIVALRGCVPEILAILREWLKSAEWSKEIGEPVTIDPTVLALAVRVLEGAER